MLKEQVAESIKRIREEKGLSREKLAKALNTSVTTIYRYEQGKLNLSADLIERIASALGVTVTILFEPKKR